MIKKVKKNKYVVTHCHGKDKGKRIPATKKPVSKKKATKIHGAIQANKARRKK